MSKLLKLKEWVTLEDAAKHLSVMFGEEVNTPDILRLALDGRLTLSVDMVNGATAIHGETVPIDRAKYFEFPSDVRMASAAKLPGEYKGDYVKVLSGVVLNDKEVIDFGDHLLSLRGVYDLPMIGSERLDVEHLYQRMTGGPPVTLQGLDGAFVLADDGTYLKLLESYDDNEFQPGSRAHGRAVEDLIKSEGMDSETASVVRAKFLADREQFKAQQIKKPEKDKYYPAGGVPRDSVFVVRTEALLCLHDSASAQERRGTDLKTRERDTLLKLVIGMAIAGYRYSPSATRSDAPAEIANDLAIQGLSVTDDTVRKWLKEAAATVLPERP